MASDRALQAAREIDRIVWLPGTVKDGPLGRIAFVFAPMSERLAALEAVAEAARESKRLNFVTRELLEALAALDAIREPHE